MVGEARDDQKKLFHTFLKPKDGLFAKIPENNASTSLHCYTFRTNPKFNDYEM